MPPSETYSTASKCGTTGNADTPRCAISVQRPMRHQSSGSERLRTLMFLKIGASPGDDCRASLPAIQVDPLQSRTSSDDTHDPHAPRDSQAKPD